MVTGPLWTADQLTEAREMRLSGMTYAAIGEAICRSPDAVYAALRKKFGMTLAREPEYILGPAIGLTPECSRYRKDCKLGSEVLRGMVMDLLNSMPPAEVVAVLGPPPVAPVPGTERPYVSLNAFGMAA